jgi:hypothetical protein
MTEGLTIGPVHTLIQDRVYALPARVIIISSAGDGDLEISLDGSNWDSITPGQSYGSLFLRSLNDDSIVVLKAAFGAISEEDMAIESVTVSLTASELQNLNSVGKELVPADPANVLVPFRLVLQFVNTVPGSGGIGNVNVRYSTGANTPFLQNASVDLATGTGIVSYFTQSSGSSFDNQTCLNRALELFAAAPGDGTQTSIVVTLWFARFAGI